MRLLAAHNPAKSCAAPLSSCILPHLHCIYSPPIFHYTLTFTHLIPSKFYLPSLKFAEKASAHDFWASKFVEMS